MDIHLYAPVKSPDSPSLDGLVLYQLVDAAGDLYVLEIRYRTFATLDSEGDHLHLGPIEPVARMAEQIYGIQKSQWRPLSAAEAAAIDGSIVGSAGPQSG